MREVDGVFKPQKGVTITVSNIGFIAMLREAFMKNTQLVPLVRFLNAIDADAKDIALARKAGDTGATTPLIDLLLSAKINLLCRKVEKILFMFPGRERMVLDCEDTKKKAAAPCLIHDALVAELTERCGEKNVVVK